MGRKLPDQELFPRIKSYWGWRQAGLSIDEAQRRVKNQHKVVLNSYLRASVEKFLDGATKNDECPAFDIVADAREAARKYNTQLANRKRIGDFRPDRKSQAIPKIVQSMRTRSDLREACDSVIDALRQMRTVDQVIISRNGTVELVEVTRRTL